MDEIIIVLLLGLLMFSGVVGVLALVALVRASRVAREVEALRAELRQRPAAPAPVAAPAPAVAPGPAAPVTADPWIVPQPVAPAPPTAAPLGERIERLVRPADTVAPVAASAAAAAPAPLAAPKRAFSFEKLIGVQGAAVLGGIVLAIAGVVLYKIAVERGWITPAVRVAMGLGLGVVCLAGSRPLRTRGYAITSDALAGGGAVVLYAACWAAHQHFGIWPVWLSYVGMIAVTVVCALLALRRSSQVVAALGFLGGFATPIALSSGGDHPIGLFGYTLIVNLGFLSLAERRRWPLLGALGLVGTFVIEALWIFGRMQVGTFWIALVALALFALLFLVFAARQGPAERQRWVWAQVGAVLMPFAFALYFVSKTGVQIGYHLAPTAALVLVLTLASGWLARRQGVRFVSIGTAAGAVGIVLVWVIADGAGDLERMWELAGCALVLAGAHHAHLELVVRAERRGMALDEGARGNALLGALIAAFGLALGLVVSIEERSGLGFAPSFAGLVGIGLLLARQAALVERRWIVWSGALVWALGFMMWCDGAPLGTTRFLSEPAGVWVLAATLAWFVVEWLGRHGPTRSAAAAAQALVLLGGLIGMAELRKSGEPELLRALGEALMLGLLLLAAVRRTPSTLLFAAAAGLLAVTFSGLALAATPAHTPQGRHALLLLGVLAMAGACAGFVGRGWIDTHGLARLRPFAALLFLFIAARLGRSASDGVGRGLGALALALVVIAAWRWMRSAATAERERERPAWLEPLTRSLAWAGGAERRPLDTARAWYAAIAALLLACAVAMQVDQEWPLVACALTGVAWAWIARREAHVPWAIGATAALALATSSLIVTRFQHGFANHPTAFFNWLLWIYLVPAACAVFAALWIRAIPSSLEREATTLRVAAGVCGVLAVILGFGWINLAILDAFGSPPNFGVQGQRVASRDLTLSLAWALYAIGLLVLGVSRRSTGLRWISLALFLATIAKVFLFDLSHLTGFYKVGSLLGLAVALLSVSLLYQRFVFRVGAAAQEPEQGPEPAPTLPQAAEPPPSAAP